jgi:hypothetical protein
MADKFVVKRVGVLSLAKTFGVIYAVIGLILGAFMTLFSLVGAGMVQSGLGVLFGVGAIILLPIFYGLAGFVVGALVAFVYNFVAGFVGGIELELG